jgi:putative membrane protein
MMYWGDHVSGWGWAAMSVSTVLFWGLVIAAIVLLMRSFSSNDQQGRPVAHQGTPEQQLAGRFARGEIGEDEFTRSLTTLRGQVRS